VIAVRQTGPPDFPAIARISRAIYPDSPPWSDAQLASHIEVFPEGQFVAELDGEVVGMAASLIVLWDDYSMDTNWRVFTADGRFTNHDPERGRTLYGAEVMVDPARQGHGIGKQLYAAGRALVERRGLLRIRAGARLCGYHRVADRMSAEDYTEKVVRGEMTDNTLTFQLKQGFEVIAVTSEYIRHDPESLGYAAVIEWINDAVATPADRGHGDPRYR
jgi:ribosomal protein S18 acetylase RimI-like enzyme